MAPHAAVLATEYVPLAAVVTGAVPSFTVICAPPLKGVAPDAQLLPPSSVYTTPLKTFLGVTVMSALNGVLPEVFETLAEIVQTWPQEAVGAVYVTVEPLPVILPHPAPGGFQVCTGGGGFGMQLLIETPVEVLGATVDDTGVIGSHVGALG